jgi:choline kinase
MLAAAAPMTVAQSVILAAGFGSRLGSAASGVPKPLIEVAGRPLIAHALEHALASGCSRAVIVIGHEGERVRGVVDSLSHRLAITFVENRETEAPNGVSLLKAEPAVDDCFFLQMVDHVFGGVALRALTESAFGDGEVGRVLIDPTPGAIDIVDATRVRLSPDRRVTAIGKHIEPWDAIDAGCFVLTRRVFDALREVGHAEPLTVSAGMRRLVAANALGSSDVTLDWVDVDTPSDHVIAEQLLAAVARPLQQPRTASDTMNR